MTDTEYKDIPITSMFLRYGSEEPDKPVAVFVRTKEGNSYLIPFTGAQVYDEYLGGNEIIPPVEVIKEDIPVVETMSPTAVEGIGPPNEEVSIVVETGEKIETKSTQSDAWGRWKIPVDSQPDHSYPERKVRDERSGWVSRKPNGVVL